MLTSTKNALQNPPCGADIVAVAPTAAKGRCLTVISKSPIAVRHAVKNCTTTAPTMGQHI